MTAREGKRPWLAATLGVLSPGLGHAYLRQWGRGALWFAAGAVAASMLLPVGVPPAEGVEAVVRAAGSLSTEAKVGLLSVSYLGALDAYWQALRDRNAEEAAGERCPECGRAREADVEFCEWCATRL